MTEEADTKRAMLPLCAHARVSSWVSTFQKLTELSEQATQRTLQSALKEREQMRAKSDCASNLSRPLFADLSLTTRFCFQFHTRTDA